MPGQTSACSLKGNTAVRLGRAAECCAIWRRIAFIDVHLQQEEKVDSRPQMTVFSNWRQDTTVHFNQVCVLLGNKEVPNSSQLLSKTVESLWNWFLNEGSTQWTTSPVCLFKHCFVITFLFTSLHTILSLTLCNRLVYLHPIFHLSWWIFLLFTIVFTCTILFSINSCSKTNTSSNIPKLSSHHHHLYWTKLIFQSRYFCPYKFVCAHMHIYIKCKHSW